MSSIPNYLTRIKSSGIYRYVFDKSIVPNLVDKNLILVVGYAEKGPFNTPVYISNYADFENTFGKLSRRLEKKGIFFHRTAQQALSGGPILALNLKPFNNETTRLLSFDPKDLSGRSNPLKTVPVDVKRIFDINRFWKLDKDLLSTLNSQTQKQYIQIVNTSNYSETNSLVIRKYVPDNFDIKVGEWYGKEVDTEIPTYLEGIKDRASLKDFFGEVYVFRGQFIKSQFEQGGPLGDYRNWIFTYQDSDDSDAATYQKLQSIMVEGGKVLEFRKYYNTPKGTDLGNPQKNKELEEFYKIIEDKGINLEQLKYKFGNTKISDSEVRIREQLNLTWQPYLIVEENGIPGSDNVSFRVNTEYRDSYGDPGDALLALSNSPLSNFIDSYQGILIPDFRDATGKIISLEDVFNNSNYYHNMLMNFNTSLLDFYGENDYDFDGILDCQPQVLNDNRIKDVDADNDTVVKEEAELWEELGLAEKSDTKNDSGKVSKETLQKDLFTQISKHLIISKDSLKKQYVTVLEGYQYYSVLPTDKDATLVNKILATLTYKGLREALTNNVDIDYHYLVDSFNSYPGKSIKSQLSQIAKAKDNALAILNFPSIPTIIKYIGSSKNIGGFDMKSIEKAGISLPNEGEGASWCAFYTQMQSIEGSTKFYIPSAGLVSKIFSEKHTSRLPYYIVAGPNYGRIEGNGLIGSDYNYARKDLDILEPFGVNVILNVPKRGYIINSNQTAKQSPVSALSKVHVRELVIFLQDEIEDMLRTYHWELNTPTLRDNVRAKATTILQLVKANGGVYEYSVVCDETNNTPEIIDNEMLILDVEIEPARGAGKMVQTLTIHKTGGISSK